MPVAVMKNVLSQIEYLGWVEYLINRKPADVNEVQMAMVLTTLSSFAGGKSKIEDFILSNGSKGKKSKTAEKSPFDVFNAFAVDME